MRESNARVFTLLDRIALRYVRDRSATEKPSQEAEIQALELGIVDIVTAERGPATGGSDVDAPEHGSIDCPICETPMDVCADHGLTEFGDLDVSLRELHCPACGMLANRIYHPSVGYESRIVR